MLRRSPHRRSRPLAAGVLAAALGLMLLPPVGALAQAPVELGASGSFAVLAGTTVTSAGVSTVSGNLGVSPGTAVTGFPPGQLSGTLHAGDGPAAQGHAALATAYADAASRAPALPVDGGLGGATLGPGVHAGATLALGGTLTLDAAGDPDAVFILQAGSTLTTTAGSQVRLTGQAQSCNVFWQVGSSATLGASSLLRGTVLAHTSVSMGDGVLVDGRILARDGAVTMDNDTVAVPACSEQPDPDPDPPPDPGGLAITAPAITPFTATLDGRTQTVRTAVGAWSVTDGRAVAGGYSVTVSATAPTVDGSAAAAGTGGLLTLSAPTASPAADDAGPGPASDPPQPLSTTATTIAHAAAGSGRGTWWFPADDGPIKSLAILIPGDAATGTYAGTLTFTVAPLAG